MLALLLPLLLGQVPGAQDDRALCTKVWPEQQTPSKADTLRCRDWWLTVHYGPRGEKEEGMSEAEADEQWLDLDPIPGTEEARSLPSSQLKRAEAHMKRACDKTCTLRDGRVMEAFRREADSRLGRADIEFMAVGLALKEVLAGRPVQGGDDLRHASRTSLRRVRNGVYARHGRPFTSVDLDEFFYTLPRSKEWRAADLPVLKKVPGYNDARLTEVDKQNLAYIQALEHAREQEHERPE
jgi:YARHG domain